MAEYIDKEAVKEIMQKHRCSGCTNEKSLDCPLCQLHKPFDEISKIPTADVVEVVRCKDCKYFNGKIDVLCERCGDIDEPCGGCHYTGGCTYDDGYCHHGERRKEDGDA